MLDKLKDEHFELDKGPVQAGELIGTVSIPVIQMVKKALQDLHQGTQQRAAAFVQKIDRDRISHAEKVEQEIQEVLERLKASQSQEQKLESELSGQKERERTAAGALTESNRKVEDLTQRVEELTTAQAALTSKLTQGMEKEAELKDSFTGLQKAAAATEVRLAESQREVKSLTDKVIALKVKEQEQEAKLQVSSMALIEIYA